MRALFVKAKSVLSERKEISFARFLAGALVGWIFGFFLGMIWFIG